MSERTIDDLLHHWRAVIGSAPKGFARDFALSIQKHRSKPGWQPTARQLVVMRRMVSELFTHGQAGEALELVERDLG
jgi:hypothetical protein